MTLISRTSVRAALAVTLAASLWPAVSAQQGYDPSLYSGLRWRMLGPFRGGRVDAVSGVPGRPNEFYMGAVNGGVWKTVDAGRVWRPIFDSQSVASIGALAVAPSSPDVVYVGTGESTLPSIGTPASCATQTKPSPDGWQVCPVGQLAVLGSHVTPETIVGA